MSKRREASTRKAGADETRRVMELDAFFAMVTGLKTACTHAGLDPKTATIAVDARDGTVLTVTVIGEGKHGRVSLKFDVA